MTKEDQLEQRLSQAGYLIETIKKVQQELEPFFSNFEPCLFPVFQKCSFSDPFLSKADSQNIMNSIGSRIKIIREKRRLTQDNLSQLTGIQRPNIARLENGNNSPNLNTLLKISIALDFPLNQLLDF